MWPLFTIILIAVPMQEKNSWKTLSDVSYKSKVVDGYEVDYPIFGNEVRELNGQTITLRGYMVPLDNLLGSNYFMLSSLPFNNCFFCGGAGPETVVEVFTVDEVKFTNRIITVQGKLRLNESDPNHHMYMLKNTIIK